MLLMTEASVANGGAFIDRRGMPRHRAILGAQIIYRDGLCATDCIILNFSDRGALLRLSDFSDLSSCPQNFVLKPRFEAPHTCELVWQLGQMVGVHFV
jgi:hypothetical protein